MKCLILKDIYNIVRNGKSLLFTIIFLGIVTIPTSGVRGYGSAVAILCCMMVLTTFSFDHHSNWAKYAMIMPISRKELVLGKFIVLLIFCTIGSVLGLLVDLVGGFITGKFSFGIGSLGEPLITTLATWAIALIFGSISIPFIFKFGIEKGRLLMLAVFLIPTAIFFGFYQLFVTLGIQFTDQLVVTLLCCSPIFAFLWGYVMYRISYRIFSRKDL